MTTHQARHNLPGLGLTESEIMTDTITQLGDVYDVHFRNGDTNNEWRRWFNAPVKNKQAALDYVQKLGKAGNIGGMVHVPKAPNTEWRIVRMVREIVETGVNP